MPGIERFAIRQKKEPVPAAVPQLVPMAEAPRAVASVPNLYPIGQKTEFGFLYGELSTLDTLTVLRTGDTMSGKLTINPASGNILELQKAGVTATIFDGNGTLDVNPAASVGVLIQARHGGVTDFFVSSSGNAHMRGNVGIGPFADTPTNRFIVKDTDVESWFELTPNTGSGSMGWRINKPDKTNTKPTVWTWLVGGKQTWDLGQDFDTNNTDNGGTGNSDFVLAYDYTAGWTDDGVHTYPNGADNLRFTPAEKSYTGKSTSWHWSGQAANRNSTIAWGIMEAGKGQSGINLSIHGTNVNQHLTFTQRNLTHNSCLINLNQQWLFGQDIGAAGVNVGDISLFQVSQNVSGTPTAVNKTRLFIQGTTANQALFGINTNNPIGILHVASDLGTALATNTTTLFTGGYSGDLANRSLNLQQISDNTNVTNALLLHGKFAGTGAAPTLTSTGSFSAGLLCNDTALSLVVAANGTAQTILKPVSINGTGDLTLAYSGGKLCFFGGTPNVKQTVSGSRGGNAALASLLTVLASTYGLIVDGTSA